MIYAAFGTLLANAGRYYINKGDLLMTKDIDRLIEKANEPMWEMANLRSQETGLNVIIFISEKGQANHGPRIKVQNDYSTHITNDWFSLTISDVPVIPQSQRHLNINIKDSDLAKIKQWIKRNKDVLLAYWNEQITTTEVLSKLRK